ncbi:MAG: sugar phosphate isomerase/epimerase [Phycisphaerae bacterium]|nr:sugar phosphate isomerase/epimerase [Phycisphaerae bacterium]
MITISAFADEIGPDLDLQMDTCEAQGIRCIDVRGIDETNVSKMTLEQVADYKRRLDDRGFTVPCIGSPIGKIRMDQDFDEHMDLLKHCFDVAWAFGTRLIRMFSFYPSQGADIADERLAVMERMQAMVTAADDADIVLLHENERAIYGAKPDGVKDIFATIRNPSFKGIFDPANFVEEGIAPYDEGWTQGLAELTDYLHVKDKTPGEAACTPAGTGKGQFAEIFADLAARGWSGYATLEPHLAAAGQFKGFTGPDLFAKAVNALKTLCDNAGIPYR